MTYTKQTLQQDLAAMGLTGTETILIHSSMKSIGAVEGGADTVLDALMEFFAEGLLLLPTHTWQFIDQDHPVFDVRRSPCCVGILPELFRQRPGVVRSLHPTHSIAACGRGAAEYLAGELENNIPLHPRWLLRPSTGGRRKDPAAGRQPCPEHLPSQCGGGAERPQPAYRQALAAHCGG